MPSSSPESFLSDLADIKRADQDVFLVLACTVMSANAAFPSRNRADLFAPLECRRRTGLTETAQQGLIYRP